MTSYLEVEFPGERAVLRGRLYRHDGPRPAVVMAHGFSATAIGMVADRYAEVLHGAGLAVLLYDHEGFGLSDGKPRQVINRWLQCRGYQHALSYAADHPCVDRQRLALWGDSLSASIAITVAAFDVRVSALVVQVPACGSVLGNGDPDGAAYAALRDFYTSADVTDSWVLGEPQPVVSEDQAAAPSLLEPITAYRWFCEYGLRPGSTWRNTATPATLATPVPFSTGIMARRLTCPSLWVIAAEDEMPGAETPIATHCFDLAGGQKEKLIVEGGHFGLLYDTSPLFGEVSQAQASFLARTFSIR